MTISYRATTDAEIRNDVFKAVMGIFQMYEPEQGRQNWAVYEFIDQLFAVFRPHTAALACSIQFDNELSVHGFDEYVIRLRHWSTGIVTAEVRSAMGVPPTMKRTTADVPIFWDDDTFVGLWLKEVQTKSRRIAYITHA